MKERFFRLFPALLVALCATGFMQAYPTGTPPPSDEMPRPETLTGRLEVVPKEANPGDTLKVVGEGCAWQVPVRFELLAPELVAQGSIESKEGGGFEANVAIPSTVKAGRATLRTSCGASHGGSSTSEATIIITRPRFSITGVNLIFGFGVALVVAGIGIGIRRSSSPK